MKKNYRLADEREIGKFVLFCNNIFEPFEEGILCLIHTQTGKYLKRIYSVSTDPDSAVFKEYNIALVEVSFSDFEEEIKKSVMETKERQETRVRVENAGENLGWNVFQDVLSEELNEKWREPTNQDEGIYCQVRMNNQEEWSPAIFSDKRYGDYWVAYRAPACSPSMERFKQCRIRKDT